MPLYLEHLDERTRQLMLAELEHDLKHNQLYISPYLSGQGQRDYPALLREAMTHGTEGTLAESLRQLRRIERTHQRRKPSGGYVITKVPDNAADIVAEMEFNRYYIRAIAQRALQDGVKELVVYRARPAAQPRPESEARVETTVAPEALLNDLRSHPGETGSLGIPAGPGSGLSVRLP